MEEGLYNISYTYFTKSYAESFRICLGQGTEPENYTTVLLDKENYKNATAVTESSNIQITEDGLYRIGLYAYSAKNMFGIYIGDVKIVSVNVNNPEPPTATVTSTGMEGLISVTLPDKNISGGDLTGTVTAKITLDDATQPFTTVSGQPGETVDAEVTVDSRGNHTFTLVATVEHEGKTLSSDHFEVTHEFTRVLPNPLPMGYVMLPDEDDMTACTIINANEDGKEWDIYNASLPSGGVNPYAFRYSANYSAAADDWLILPAYEGVDSGVARLDFLFGTKAAKESLEIAVASTPDIEALQENIVWNIDNYSTNDKFEDGLAYLSVTPGEEFYIAFHCNSPASRGYVYVQNIVVTESLPIVPVSPEFGEIQFDGGDGTIQLTLPSQTITDADIEGNVYVEVKLDGEPFGEPISGTPGEEVTLTFADLQLGDHALSAVPYVFDESGARFDGRGASLNFRVKPGSNFFYTLPMDMQINPEMLEASVIIDSNEDGITWTYNAMESALSLKYNNNLPGNDWYISPAIQIDNVAYDFIVSVKMKAQSASYTERFEVKMGTTQNVEGMTIDVLPATETQITNYTDYEATVTLPAPGRYYIGVHGFSNKDQHTLFLRSLHMESTDPFTGVKEAALASGNAVGLKGAISLRGFAGQEVSVTNLAGQLIKAGKISADNESVAVAPGIYVVKAAGRTFKVIVK